MSISLSISTVPFCLPSRSSVGDFSRVYFTSEMLCSRFQSKSFSIIKTFGLNYQNVLLFDD